MSGYISIKGHEIGRGRPLVCVSVVSAARDEILSDITQLVDSGIEMVEWRVDAYEEHHSMNAIREMLAAIKPIVAKTVFLLTFRTRQQGGLGELDSDLCRDIRETAGESGAVDIIDVEFFAEEHPILEIHKLHKLGVYVMTSHHDFSETPQAEVIRMLIERAYESGADMVKLALMPKTMDDVLRLFSETHHFHEQYPTVPIITMSMGKMGAFSRFLGEYSGSCITWATWKHQTAPGQMDCKEIRELIDRIHNL